METLLVQFQVTGDVLLDDNNRQSHWSSGAFERLPLNRASQAWEGVVPGQYVFIAQTQSAAIFITREWEAAIKSRRLIDCVGAMCATLNVLREQLDTSVGIVTLDTGNDTESSFTQQLDGERSREKYVSFAKTGLLMLVGALVSALVSVLISAF